MSSMKIINLYTENLDFIINTINSIKKNEVEPVKVVHKSINKQPTFIEIIKIWFEYIKIKFNKER